MGGVIYGLRGVLGLVFSMGRRVVWEALLIVVAEMDMDLERELPQLWVSSATKVTRTCGGTRCCNVFEEFCHQVAAALVLSLLGSVAFFLLVVLAALNLHKKCK
ncbi:hypothetical protein Acr_24g0002330 [Actinidia rufa]|uniref:Uncharacterized protein n=1 Tax=Actinidia rufa TaxID=165716 RepID=A0A7J0GTD5_9ERIC|nr:hypothetical protein Acr_24g0002330 [Actinidia rufa]